MNFQPGCLGGAAAHDGGLEHMPPSRALLALHSATA